MRGRPRFEGMLSTAEFLALLFLDGLPGLGWASDSSTPEKSCMF